VRSFLNHADLFAFGMGLAVLMVNIEDGHIRLPRWWRRPAYLLLGGMVCATVLLVDRGLIYGYRGAVEYDLITGCCAALILAVVALPAADSSISLLTRVLETRILVAMGLISYSVFLWHEPLIRWAKERGFTLTGSQGFWVNILVLGVATSLLSAITYRFVERPALARKRR
jgi:peptidoglycan/LPS O-acetylase OafA/YrhL